MRILASSEMVIVSGGIDVARSGFDVAIGSMIGGGAGAFVAFGIGVVNEGMAGAIITYVVFPPCLAVGVCAGAVLGGAYALGRELLS